MAGYDDVNLYGRKEDNDRNAEDLSNDELCNEFYDYVDKRTKDSTADFYRRNFAKFHEYVKAGDGHLTETVGSRDIENFLTREAEEYAPKTVTNRYSAISRFYHVIRDKLGFLPDGQKLPIERVEKDDIVGMSDKTVSEVSDGEEFHYLSSDEVTRLIENVPAPELRNRAMLMVMANTGLRASELIRVRIDDDNLNLEGKRLTVLSPKKSDDDDNDPEWIDVYWRSQKVSEVLDSYLQFDRPTYPYADDSPYLFPSMQSERIGRGQLNRVVREAAENAGLQSSKDTNAAGNQLHNVTSHVLRHSYAMASLENGMSIDEIRDNLHHSDISVTMKYLRRHEEDRRRAVEKHGPQFG